MVLRRGRAEDPGIAEVAGRLRDLDHPLAVLPLHLLPAEQELDLPAYHFRGHSAAMPFGPYRPATEHREPALQLLPAVEDVTDDLTSQLICSAVSRWASDSHGQTEARTFRLRAAGPAQLTADLLAILPIQALEGVGVGHIAARPATVTDVLAVLFAAASSGPAHGGGLAGAYGRLHAWRSLAGLTGAALAEPVPQLADRAAAARYLLFSARSAWYRQVAWDIGIAAFRPGDQVLVILAATDTD
jgi:hypothetical protein